MRISQTDEYIFRPTLSARLFPATVDLAGESVFVGPNGLGRSPASSPTGRAAAGQELSAWDWAFLLTDQSFIDHRFASLTGSIGCPAGFPFDEAATAG